MQVNILEIFSNDVFEEAIEKALDINSVEFNHKNVELLKPIVINAHFKKIDEKEITINGDVKTTLKMHCDRCNKEVAYDLEADFFKDVSLNKVNNDEEDDFIKGYLLDLEKLALSEVYLNFPMKVLCEEACKGICKQCGVNLNDEQCKCENDDIDPRLADLKALFDNNFKEV